MSSNTFSFYYKKLQSMDWALFKGSVLISAGMLVSRALGFIFYLILARNFAPEEYGSIQYQIVIAELVAICTQPFGQHVVARFIGIYKESPVKLREFSSNSWVIMAVIFIATLLLGIPFLLYQSLDVVSILIVFVGLTFFYSYWGLSRGYLASGRLVIAYLGSNALQLLLTFIFIQFYQIKSTFLALVIYGGNYLVMLLILQVSLPLSFPFNFKLVKWQIIKPILIFFLPVFISHITYLLSFSLDILLLKQFVPIGIVGQYSLAKSLSAIFSFVPSGIGTILMPKIASQPKTEQKKLFIQSLAFSIILNLVFLIMYIIWGELVIKILFGVDYIISRKVLITLSIGTMLFGIRSIISSVLVGVGKVSWETLGWFVILLSSVVSGLYLIPAYGAFGAALMTVLGAVSGLIMYIFLNLYERKRR